MKKIPLSGIDRNSGLAMAEDGAADYVVNLRKSGGAFMPIKKWDMITSNIASGVKPVYIHKTAEYENILGTDSEGNIYVIASKKYDGEWQEDGSGVARIQGIRDIKHIGNTLIVAGETSLTYILYKNGAYEILGEKIPELKIRFGSEEPEESDYNGKIVENIEYQYRNSLPPTAEGGELEFGGRRSFYDGCLYAVNNYATMVKALKSTPGTPDENGYYDFNMNVTQAQEEYTNNFLALYNQAVSTIYSTGDVCQPCLFSAAIRLYDKTYSNPTPFIYPFDGILNGEALKEDGSTYVQFRDFDGYRFRPDLWYFVQFVKEAEGDTSEDKAGRPVIRIKPKRMYYYIENADELKKWSDIISSVDIFMSKPVVTIDTNEKLTKAWSENQPWIVGGNPYKTEDDGSINNDYVPLNQTILGPYPTDARGNAIVLNYRPTADVVEDIENTDNMYRIERIELNNYKDGKTYLNNAIKRYYPILEQCQTLRDIAQSDTLTADQMFVYNNRLHLAGVYSVFNSTQTAEQLMLKEYDWSEWTLFPQTNPIKYYTYAIVLELISGSSKFYTTIEYDKESGVQAVLSSLLSVFKSDVDKIIVHALLQWTHEGNTYRKSVQKEFLTFPSDFFELSQYLSEQLRLNTITGDWEGDGIVEYDFPADDPEAEDISIVAYDWIQNLTGTWGEEYKPVPEYKPNEIRVSQSGNPFSFLTENNIKVGGGKIVSLATVTNAISEGQYGQFPLNVFTTDGIYSLSVGTTVAYASIDALSRHVATSEAVPIDGAVVFNTDKGVMILSGRSIKSLSDIMDGKGTVVQNYLTTEFPLSSSLIGQGVEFYEELKNCSIGYNYKKDELLFIPANESAGTQMYVCDLANKIWSIRRTTDNVSYTDFLSSYPDLYAIGEAGGKSFIENCSEENGETMPYQWISRVTAFGTEADKKLRSLVLRCFIKGDFTSSLRLLLLAGNNPKYLSKAGGVSVKCKEDSSDMECKDLHIRRIPVSAKYYQVCIYGTSGEDTQLNYLEADFNPPLDSELR